MAENIITLEFVPCEPAPVNGYLVKYRPLGSLSDYRVVSPNQTESPIVITDDNDAPGTSYEGTIQGDCGGGIYGVPSPWEFIVDQNESSSGSESDSGGANETTLHLTYDTGQWKANIDDALDIILIIDGMTVNGATGEMGCSEFEESDNQPAPMILPAFSLSQTQAGATPLSCDSDLYQMSNFANVNGMAVSNGSTIVTGGVTLHISIVPTFCSTYPC